MKRIINNRQYVVVTDTNKEDGKFELCIGLPSPDEERRQNLELVLPLLLIRAKGLKAKAVDASSNIDHYSEIRITYHIIYTAIGCVSGNFEDIVNNTTKNINELCTALLAFTD